VRGSLALIFPAIFPIRIRYPLLSSLRPC
jgi:hypothetical protein